LAERVDALSREVRTLLLGGTVVYWSTRALERVLRELDQVGIPVIDAAIVARSLWRGHIHLSECVVAARSVVGNTVAEIGTCFPEAVTSVVRAVEEAAGTRPAILVPRAMVEHPRSFGYESIKELVEDIYWIATRTSAGIIMPAELYEALDPHATTHLGPTAHAM